jgi:hypothetical protein
LDAPTKTIPLKAVAEVNGETQQGGSSAEPGLNIQSSFPMFGSVVGDTTTVDFGGNGVETSIADGSVMIVGLVCSVGDIGALVHPPSIAITIRIKLVRNISTLFLIRRVYLNISSPPKAFLNTS